jgi:hypothetical protein
MKSISLNGWQRIWVFLTIIWLLLLIWVYYPNWSLMIKLKWDFIAPPLVAYLIGQGVAWIRKGF